MTTTLDDVRVLAKVRDLSGQANRQDYYAEVFAVRECYAEGNATLQQLATATGLSKARIHQIVGGK